LCRQAAAGRDFGTVQFFYLAVGFVDKKVLLLPPPTCHTWSLPAILKNMTMNRIFFLIVILLSNSAFGQDKVAGKNRRFFIGVNFSPDYCYRSLSKNIDSISNSKWNYAKNIEDSVEIPKLGYTAGINFGYQIKSWLSIETGLQYSDKGYKTIPVTTVYDFSHDPEIAM
jgi:hypothetical protein